MVESNPEWHDGYLVQGRFRIIRRLGVGGMGEVYLADDARLGRNLALKMLPTKYTENEARLGRFQREALAASALNHPNIVTIYDIGQDGSVHFIATEFIDGVTLRQLIKQEKLAIDEVLDIAIQVANALSAAHSAGIVHRDIKPENIMLRPDRHVKVLDFGLAKLIQPVTSKTPLPDQDQVKTEPGIVLGTPYYMSPEQARGDAVDHRTDVFSLGAVIYEMITGQLAFPGRTVSDVIAALLNQEPAPLKHHLPDTPDELQLIVSHALSKTKDNRYQDAKALANDLKNLKQLSNEQARIPTQIQANTQPVDLSNDADAHKVIKSQDLKAHKFEYVTLNARGTPVRRQKGSTRYFAEQLSEYMRLQMVEIPGGTFLMGSPDTEEGRNAVSESPQHSVTVPPFYMSMFPITNAQWNKLISRNVKGGTIELLRTPFDANEELPRVSVSWEEAVEFCDRLSWLFMKEYRLPTEAEWEYACRAGTTTPFCFGETIVPRVANFLSNVPYKAAIKAPPRNGVVASTSLEGANAFGLYDMHGNVLEWCLDKWHDNYEGAPTDGSAWEDRVKNKDEEDKRVLRGGSYNFMAAACRSASRHSEQADKKFSNVGFRVVVPIFW